jgi:hypothetical protein
MISQPADGQLSTPRPRTWVWFSTSESTRSGVFSILAAVEVVFAIGIYWTYAIWAHTQWHLLVGVFIAPFLLLRSEKSTTLAVKWFTRYDAYLDKLVERSEYSRIYGFLAVPGMLVGLLFALLVRILATARHPVKGISSLSRNWWRTIFATDLLSEPEIIPDYQIETSIFAFSTMKRIGRRILKEEFQNLSAPGVSRWRFLAVMTRIIPRAGALGIVYAIFFGPAYLYRLSIKSTAWAHWPLSYIARPLKYADDPDEVQARLWSDPREWVRRVFMILTFVGALIATLPSFSQVRQTFDSGPISVLEYVFLIDIKTLLFQP